jgi:zona occludens toxin
MPLKAYVGLPRAGKSYEVVTQVILPALRQGRRVVSNIAGLNYEAFCSILYSEGISQDKIGTILHIEHDAVKDPNFWRTDFDNAAGTQTVIQPGDLVALDEIWRFWKKRGDIQPRCMNFMRMHGHMSHPITGLTCEIALITQSIRDINENIRDVIQETFQCIKNTKLGSEKSYIVQIYQRGSTAKVDAIRTLPPRFYKSEFFPLYKSHSQHKEGDAQAQEKNPDTRSSILKGAFFTVVIPAALVCGAIGVWWLWGFFHPVPVEPVPESTAQNTTTTGAQVINNPQPAVNEQWCVVGYFARSGSFVF